MHTYQPRAIDRILSQRQVIELVGLSRTTIWKLERNGQFPKKRQLSPFRIGWRCSDIEAWIELGMDGWVRQQEDATQ